MDLGAGSGGRPSKIMKTIDSVREVCTFREKACILYGRCAFFKKKKPCVPLGRGEHEVRTSRAFWSLSLESSHLPSVLAVFEEREGGETAEGGRRRRRNVKLIGCELLPSRHENTYYIEGKQIATDFPRISFDFLPPPT